jgi:hypothetical protein
MGIANITLTDEQVEDILDTALYGGITYWAELVPGDFENPFPTVIREIAGDLDNGRYPVHEITPEVIRRGFARYPEHLVNKTTLVGSLHIYEVHEVPGGITTDIDVDAGAADLIVQFGLFGEERYA